LLWREPSFGFNRNGDDGATATAIFIATQEVSTAAAATGVGAVAVPFIELAGAIWGLVELLDDVPPATVKKPEAHTSPAITVPKDVATTKPNVETRKKQTEAEIDEANEQRKIKAMEEKAAKAGQTKANTKHQEKEAGQNYEEINRAQQQARNTNQGNKINETKKSEQNDKKEINREAQEALDKK
jgi:hypothetical protein